MNFDLRFYWRLFVRRLPAMTALFLICLIIGLVMAARLPPSYRAEARLVVENAQIPGNLAASTVTTGGGEAIEIIRQRLFTRANMLDIAQDMNVFADYSALSPDDIVEQMRQSTRINSRGGINQPLIVTVAFDARTGQIAANVVNEYVTRIIRANVELRTTRSGATLTFFEQEVARLGTELELQSQRISEFQRQNASALPEEQNFRLNRQAILQERITNAERERSTLNDQRTRVITIFEETGQLAGTSDAGLSPAQRQLRTLENEMATALTVFSETNPRVVTLQRRIQQLREQVATELGQAGPQRDGTQSLLELQIADIDGQIAALDTLIAEAGAELADLEDAIARTPLNAITLNSLRRDYDNIRSQYDNAVARLADASTGDRIEQTSRGQRISLIEAANVPRSPASPNRPLIAATGAAAGLGLAAGLFLLLELLNRSIRRPVELTKSLGITPVSTIPYIESLARRRTRQALQIAAIVVVVIGVPAALWSIDQYYMPLDRLAERVLGRIGLT